MTFFATLFAVALGYVLGKFIIAGLEVFIESR